MYAAANAVWGARTRDRQREWDGLQQEPNFGTPHPCCSGFDIAFRRELDFITINEKVEAQGFGRFA